MNDADDVAPKRTRFLTLEQVADELNVGLPTVRMLLKSGELRGIQIGARGLWRVANADLDAYVAEAYRLTAKKIAAGEIEGDAPE
jgi:excisionase family DNA binding protein